MGERIKTNTKKPLSVKENSGPHKQKTGFQSQSSHVDQILFLQRTIGNQAVQRMIKSGVLQAKLKISLPGDTQQRENWQMPMPHVISMVHGEHHIQREISTPLKNVDEKKTAKLKIGKVEVFVKHDIKTKDKTMKNRAKTSFKIHEYKFPSYSYKKGKVTKISGPLPKIKMTIHTVYGPGVTAKSQSGYGKGTTKGDKKAGKTTLGYHEGSHGTDYLQYLKDNPTPQFEGKVGMTVKEYKNAMKAYNKQIKDYRNKMEGYSKKRTDCVGIEADFCSE